MDRPDFRRLTDLPKGTILSLLRRAYAPYFAEDPDAETIWHESWVAYDADVHAFLDTVGAAGLSTFLKGTPIGFVSWDPRHKPALIGHNCVLPEFQGRGFGEAQVRSALARLTELGFRRVRVTTGDHSFFAPAQAMYTSCGFREVGRSEGDPSTRTPTIDYEWTTEQR